jgi:hypothetical protein
MTKERGEVLILRLLRVSRYVSEFSQGAIPSPLTAECLCGAEHLILPLFTTMFSRNYW